MKMQQLPDGNWATTPVFVGPSPLQMCFSPKNEHVWEDSGTPEPCNPEETAPDMKFIRMQKCRHCAGVRALLTKEK